MIQSTQVLQPQRSNDDRIADAHNRAIEKDFKRLVLQELQALNVKIDKLFEKVGAKK